MKVLNRNVVALSAAMAASAMVSESFGAYYQTPYTPAGPNTLYTSYSGNLTAGSPVWRRAAQSANGSETAPNAPTALGSAGNYPYHDFSFTPAVSGSYEMYSAQAYDGYLHLYTDPFNPATQLTNVLAGDDDMTSLNSGAVPNRNGVPTGNDSGFRFNLNGGTTYHLITSTFSAAVPSNGNFYNEVYKANPATPVYSIPDNNPAGVNITLNITDPGVVGALNSVKLINLRHTWTGDLVVTLTHVQSGKTVDLMDRVDVDGTSTAGLSSDLIGDYTLVDGGPAWPTVTGAPTSVSPGTYTTFPNAGFGASAANGALADFFGDDIAGDWVLYVSDRTAIDTGTVSAFGLDMTVIPEPASLGLIAGAALLGLNRRRR